MICCDYCDIETLEHFSVSLKSAGIIYIGGKWKIRLISVLNVKFINSKTSMLFHCYFFIRTLAQIMVKVLNENKSSKCF